MSIVELPADAVIPAGTAQEERPASVAEPVSPQTAERRKANKAKRKQTETPTLLDPENLAHKKTSQDDQEQVRSQPFFSAYLCPHFGILCEYSVTITQ